MKEQITKLGRGMRHEYLRAIAIGCILLFAILPLITLTFHVSGKDWQYILSEQD